MIQGFRDKRTEELFRGRPTKSVPSDVVARARRKLMSINAAHVVEDLLVPPGNRLEKLSGNRSGQYSIRVNDQWRICFRWSDGDAYDVEFCDYH
jgi:proteic killer suppression protein